MKAEKSLLLVLLVLLSLAALCLTGCGSPGTTLAQFTPTAATTGTGGSTTAASAMFRADLERTGVYPGGGPTQLPGLVWKLKAGGAARGLR
jgi:hypothetical protein